MVNMDTTEANSALQTAREQALQLETKKTKLEDELKEWLSILDKNRVGMNETLVDNEGFPRNDIDVYQVRHARHKIICVRNDLKKLMQEIEQQLHIIHAESQSLNTSEDSMEYETSPDTPIVKVTSVAASSPAEEAGLTPGDLITHFGSVNSSNFNSLADISNIVQHSVNQLIKVIVSRSNKVVKIYLKPHTWSGNGLLGCVILPFENVER